MIAWTSQKDDTTILLREVVAFAPTGPSVGASRRGEIVLRNRERVRIDGGDEVDSFLTMWKTWRDMAGKEYGERL